MKAAGCSLRAVGVVTSLGSGVGGTWPRLLAGDVTSLSLRDDLVRNQRMLVAQVAERLPTVPSELARHACRNNMLSLAALRQIEHEIRAAADVVSLERVGVVMGSSTAGMAAAEAAVATVYGGGVLPEEFDYTQLEFGGVAGFIADYLSAGGPCYAISTACSSGAKALASARALLELDLCDVVVAGGSDSLCRTTAAGFRALRVVSDAPSLPFSRNRAGFTLGEGSAVFLVTRDIDGIQLIGVGESSDAHHMSAPQPDGGGAEIAMCSALRDAGLSARAVHYLNLHGTGTALNDASESKAVHRVFGDGIACSSTKPLVGHTLGASGAIEAAVCWSALRAIRDHRLPLPPHHWDGEPDAELAPLNLARAGDCVRVDERAVVMSNSFGFGGNNCTLILSTTTA